MLDYMRSFLNRVACDFKSVVQVDVFLHRPPTSTSSRYFLQLTLQLFVSPQTFSASHYKSFDNRKTNRKQHSLWINVKSQINFSPLKFEFLHYGVYRSNYTFLSLHVHVFYHSLNYIIFSRHVLYPDNMAPARS